MILTKCSIEAMGFTEYPEDDSLEIEFAILKAFSLRGTYFQKDCETKSSESLSFGDNCKVVVSQSINEASKLLTGDVVIDEPEEEWLSKKKATPPFVLIYFKESSSRTLNGGWRQEKDGYIYTYDAFPEGKLELRKWENESLPSIITSLTVHFSTLDRQATLVPVERSIFGITKGGQTLFDRKLSGSIEGSASSSKNVKEINSSLQNSKTLYAKLTKETTRHVFAALDESDKLKQFLNYFLFLERYTHSQYKELSFDEDVISTFNVPERLKDSGISFFKSQFDSAKNLSQRFHWCAMLAWSQIDDSDLACFLELKKIRDKVAHGEEIDESTLPVDKIKTLALKLLGTERT